jgi:hypothetical protein
MATLKTNTLTGTSTAGSIAVTGEGNSTTTNLQQGLDKMWIFFNGSGTVATEDSFNATSLTDNGTGDYTVDIVNDMGNANYAYFLTVSQLRHTGTGFNFRGQGFPGPVTASAIRVAALFISATDGSGTAADVADVNISIKGDLA